MHNCEHRLSGYLVATMHCFLLDLTSVLHMDIALGTRVPLLSSDEVVMGRLGHMKVAACLCLENHLTSNFPLHD